MSAPRHGLGDPRIPWTILLRADGVHPAADLTARLAALASTQGWPRPEPAITRVRPAELAVATPDPVAVASEGGTVLVAADHSRLDGLSLLAVLGRLLGSDVRSSATGITDDRPAVPLAAAALRRSREVLLHPPAVPATTVHSPVETDVFAEAAVEGDVSTATLVVAGARAVTGWNRMRQRRSRQVSVAIGVSTAGGDHDEIADRSAYLRLTSAETMSVEEVRAEIRRAPLQPGGAAPAGLLGRLAGVGTRLLAPRLGSSLLVSHLGHVDTDACTDLAFHPVTGGASGLALGAVGIGGHTTLTLRARGLRHDEDGLRMLLEHVLGEVDRAR